MGGPMVRSRRFWISILVLVPAWINGFVWGFLVSPQQVRFQDLRNAQNVQHQEVDSIQALKELQPRLEAVVKEGSQLLTGLEDSHSAKASMAVATHEIQQMAARHHVQIDKMNVKRTEGNTSKASQFPLQMEVTGKFNRLAYWMNELESQKGFRIDSWVLTPGKGTGQEPHLSLEVVTLLGSNP